MTFGDKLREVRRGHNMTQAELGALLGKTGATVCDWEKGKSQPDLEELIKLADLFHVTTDYLLGRIISFAPFSELVSSWNGKKIYTRNITIMKKFSPNNFQLLEDLIYHLSKHQEPSDLLWRLFQSVGYRLDTVPVAQEDWEEPIFELSEERAFRLQKQKQEEDRKKHAQQSRTRGTSGPGK